MRPLQAVGLGLVVIALSARLHGYDLYADWAGWLLVLWGTHALRDVPLERRPTLLTLAALALVVAAVLWVPPAADWLADAEPALRWAADVPGVGYFVLLCHELAAAALRGRGLDPRGPRAAAWWRIAQLMFAAVLAAPVLVFGAGWAGLESGAGLLGVLAQLLTVILLFAHAGRPWARPPAADETAPSRRDDSER